MILFMYNTVLGCSTWDSQQDFELWGYLHGVLEAACSGKLINIYIYTY